MRALILIAGAALAVAGCGRQDQAANTTNVDESLASEQVLSNDVTAIDAVTAEDSNMAADVALTSEFDNSLAPSNSQSGSKARPAASKPSPAGATTNAATPMSNSTAAATTNNTL